MLDRECKAPMRSLGPIDLKRRERISWNGEMTNSPYMELLYARAQRVLKLVMGASLDRTLYLNGYDRVARFVETHGSVSLILDLTAVENFDISAEFARAISAMQPAIPAGQLRVVTAPQPVIYGVCRIVQTLRSTTRAPIKLVDQIEDAYTALGVKESDFERVDSSH
jgi:hypothetical protein